MFVCSLRASTLKFTAIVAVSVIALVALIAFVPGYEAVSLPVGEDGISYENIKTEEDRVRLAAAFGWDVVPQAKEEATVTVPREFDTVYETYNDIQKTQGLNLEKYRGKTVVRYTYVVTNYKGYDGEVYLNLLTYKNKVVGGDVCSASPDGFVHGFQK